MQMHLVEDWRKLHTWLSVQFAASLAGVTVAYDQLPILQHALEASAFHKIQAGLAIGVVAARVINQSKKDQPKEPQS